MPEPKLIVMNSDIIREFHIRYFPNEKDKCWIWFDNKTKAGYGVLSVCKNKQQTNYLAHRISYMIFNNLKEYQGFILHKCNNRLCINPEHLYDGTQKQNALDKIKDNTMLRGEAIWAHKLTEEQVLEIRFNSECGYSQRRLAKIYKISRRSIQHIINNKTWKHI